MITLSKLAKLAHVSLSTASKAFSMSSEVNEKTREEIFEIARQYGCFKKFYNAKYPKHVIAAICPEYRSGYYSSVIESLQRILSENGCELCVATTNFSEETEKEQFEYYSKYTAVDGIIVIFGNPQNYAGSETPVVFVDSEEVQRGDFSSVTFDIREPLSEAVDKFLLKDIKDIGYIGEEKATRKELIFRDIIREKSIPVENYNICVSKKRFEEGGYEGIKCFLRGGRIPRVVVCAYDNMAIGAIRCLADNGYKVPDDVAVLGMDNNQEGKYLVPSLSTIDFCIEELCKSAVSIILSSIKNNSAPRKVSLKGKLCNRQSTDIK